MEANWRERLCFPVLTEHLIVLHVHHFTLMLFLKMIIQKQAQASVASVIRNVSVPYGLNTQEEPNISSTRWQRTVADHKQMPTFESASHQMYFGLT